MTPKRHFSLTDNVRHKSSLRIVTAGALALVLGGLAACGQNGQQDSGNPQQDQTGQTQGQTGQPGQQPQQQDQTQGTR